MSTRLPKSVDIPNIWFKQSTHTSKGYHTNPIVRKTHPTANSDWKIPKLFLSYRCNYGSSPKRNFRTPNHGHQSTHQHHNFLELLCKTYWGHSWIKRQWHDIIYQHRCLLFKCYRRTKPHRRIFILMNQPQYPTKPTTVLPDPKDRST